ncbi:STAS domain-containing protein [Streptomyces polygonati]|uniref:STAS domain-containing protein n=1 Tax=Streptomyces polygonati TaxID=1617087 RepID=A0ABV8HUY5_9ACTN
MIRAAGDFDADTVHLIQDPLRAFPATRTIVDLSEVSFADFALLNLLLDARPTHHLVLAGLPRHLRRLFDLTSTAACRVPKLVHGL